MDLATLITARMRASGDSYRALEKKAEEGGHPISRSTLNGYALGTKKTHPDAETIAGITAALGIPYEEVAAAVHESFGVDAGDTVETGRTVQRVNAWLRLTADRSEEEIEHLLAAVESVIKMDEALRRRRSGEDTQDPHN